MVAVCIQACMPASAPDLQTAWQRLVAVMPGRHPHCCQGCDNEVSVHKCEMKRICSSWSDTKYGASLFTINGGWGRNRALSPLLHDLQDSKGTTWLGFRSLVF